MRFGQYELQGRIAVGGMAEVYRGRALGEEGFEKPVAIKRILPQLARDGRFVRMLVLEARIHAQLSHRNIVQIHDLGISEEGEYFIVLEYVDGPDLATLLETLAKTSGRAGARLRLSDPVALHIAIELGEGLHFAHEMRSAEGQPLHLVHRDISPSNVLISYAGEVKLSDFGLAKRSTDDSVVGSLKGKLAYMSPEQARRAPLDRRSDVFALGAVLFEMLTGRRLRELTDDLGAWQQVASGVLPSPRAMRPDLPVILEQLLTRALAPNPEDRFEDARAFVSAARQALEAVPRVRASEPVELQELLKRVLPPGSPRRRTEQSKVIRLVAELPGAFEEGGDPRVKRTGNETNGAAATTIFDDNFDRSNHAAPVPHARADRTPAAAPPLLARTSTPSAPIPLTRPRATPSEGVLASAAAARRGETQQVPAAAALSGPEARRAVAAAIEAGESGARPALGWEARRRSGAADGGAARPTTAEAPRSSGALQPARAPRNGSPPVRWTAEAVAPATVGDVPDALPPRAPSACRPTGGIFARLDSWETADGSSSRGQETEAAATAATAAPRARLKAGGWWGFALTLALAAAALLVHMKLVPLDLIAVWWRPVRLEVTSSPPGADVYLDGQRLSAPTPLLIEIDRDRRPHALEVRKAGWKSATRSLRLDRSASVALSISFSLERLAQPQAPPRPSPPRRGRAAPGPR